jgi:hypothetical protein
VYAINALLCINVEFLEFDIAALVYDAMVPPIKASSQGVGVTKTCVADLIRIISRRHHVDIVTYIIKLLSSTFLITSKITKFCIKTFLFT